MNENKWLYQDFAIYVSNNFVIKKRNFKINHNDLLLNHFVRARTKIIIRKEEFLIKHSTRD